MEPEVHQVLLWLYQVNPWLYIIFTLQRVIIFWGRKVNSNFEGKTRQVQLANIPKLQIFFWKTNPLTNYNL